MSPGKSNKKINGKLAKHLTDVVRILIGNYAHEQALNIQRVVRGHKARNRARELRTKRAVAKAIHRAATKIQGIIRKFKAVRLFAIRKQNALLFAENFTFTSDPQVAKTFNFDSSSVTFFASAASLDEAPRLKLYIPQKMVIHVLTSIITIQGLVRKAIAVRRANCLKMIREKDQALDAAMRTSTLPTRMSVAEPTATTNAEKDLSPERKQSINKHRKKSLQAALSEARRKYEQTEKEMLVEERKRFLRARHFRSPNSSECNTPRVLDEAELGKEIYHVEVPSEEGQIGIKVFKKPDCVTFRAYLAIQDHTYYLRFKKDSQDQDMIHYFEELSKPNPQKLCQVLCYQVTYSLQRVTMIMDLEPFEGKQHVFEAYQPSAPFINAPNLPAQRYLLLQLEVKQYDHYQWRVVVTAMNSKNGEKLSTQVSLKEWQVLGLGQWTDLCILEKQQLIRQVYRGLSISRSTGAMSLVCKLEAPKRERENMVDPKISPVRLNPLDLEFVKSSTLSERLILREEIKLFDMTCVCTFIQHPTLLRIRVEHSKSGLCLEKDITATDFIFFLSSPHKDTIQFCRWLKQGLSIGFDSGNKLAIFVALNHVTPLTTFEFQAWIGALKSFITRLYKCGSRLLVVCQSKSNNDVYYSLVGKEYYNKWGVSNLKKMLEDPDVMSSFVEQMKRRMLVLEPLNHQEYAYLLLETKPSKSDEGVSPQEGGVDEQGVVHPALVKQQEDGSIEANEEYEQNMFNFLGILLDKDCV